MTVSSKNRKPGEVAQETVGRRTVLEWFGKATMVSLASPLIAACMGDEQYYDPDSESSESMDTGGTGAAGENDTDTPTDASGDSASAGESGAFDFAPGPGHPLLDEFVIFTVDEQNVANTIASWNLTIDGLVETPVTLSFADLVKMEADRQVTDFHCVTGWSVYDVPWVGVTVKALLDLAVPLDTATHVTYHCQGDIYTEGTTLAEALEPKSIMAYGVGENTLPLEHGFPLRLVIPRKLAYKSAKYVYRIELTDAAHMGYWQQRGYSFEADVPESRLREGKY